jgi:hypothetical protein
VYPDVRRTVILLLVSANKLVFLLDGEALLAEADDVESGQSEGLTQYSIGSSDGQCVQRAET